MASGENSTPSGITKLQDIALSTGRLNDQITIKMIRNRSNDKEKSSPSGTNAPVVYASPLVKKPAIVQKSIVNILAEDVIKEPKEASVHRLSSLSHMTKKTLTRRSNLRHALADEKSKKLLQSNNPLTQSNLKI